MNTIKTIHNFNKCGVLNYQDAEEQFLFFIIHNSGEKLPESIVYRDLSCASFRARSILLNCNCFHVNLIVYVRWTLHALYVIPLLGELQTWETI